ncbi:MAG: hypothetical protein EBR81_09320 [Proteobacteria bacterium]|nr:hypothetical protein [Pseudomonadota bacterium]
MSELPSLPSPPSHATDDQGFDLLEFWIRHRKSIQISLALLVAAMVTYAVSELLAYRRNLEAAEAFALAQTPEQLSEFINGHRGMVASGNAALLLSGKQRANGQLDESLKTLRDFLSSSADHPMASAARLGIATTLEAQGKQDEALMAYRSLLAADSRGFAAPVAQLRIARIFKSQNKFEEAKASYESLQSQFPASSFANEALLESQQLSAEHPSAPEPTLAPPNSTEAPAATQVPATTTPATPPAQPAKQ